MYYDSHTHAHTHIHAHTRVHTHIKYLYNIHIYTSAYIQIN